MNFSIPLTEEQTRIKLVKKGDPLNIKEIKKPALASVAHAKTAGTMPDPASAPTSSASAASGTVITASANVIPAPKTTQPKVQLVEVEPGIYDIYFTCACCEQYVIRCESLEKAAAAPPSAS